MPSGGIRKENAQHTGNEGTPAGTSQQPCDNAAAKAIQNHRIKGHGHRIRREEETDRIDGRSGHDSGDDRAEALLACARMEEKINTHQQRHQRTADIQRHHAQIDVRQPAADEDCGHTGKRLPVGERHAVEHALKHAEEDEQRNDNQ